MIPLIKTRVPGLASKRLLARLREVECHHVTYADRDFPIFIESASGVNVTDADGNRYLDLTSFFSVSSLGHGHPAVRKAAEAQLNKGWHAMGDVHPPRIKVECAEALKRVLPKRLGHLFFSSSGSEAVETALKTAFLATKKSGVIAFSGAYHGLGYGAMQATHRRYFSQPFDAQTKRFVWFAPFVSTGDFCSDGEIEAALQKVRVLVRGRSAGAIMIEAVQGRGGIREADPRFLRGLRRIARDEKALLIFDEIFTGFGRTGRMFAYEHAGVEPDLVTLGKAMSNGFPISACAGTAAAMAAWGRSPGEARHTSTFLGHPLGCAMTVASLAALEAGGLLEKGRLAGAALKTELVALAVRHPKLVSDVRGTGPMIGVEMRNARHAHACVKRALKAGLILLGSGERGQTLSFTPPFTISASEIRFTVRALDRIFSGL